MSHSAPSNEELLFFLERELPKSRSFEIASHLEGCQECSHRLANLQGTVDCLGELGEEYAAMDLSAGIRAALEEEPRPKQRRRPFQRVVLLGGAGALAASLLLVFIPSTEEPAAFRAKSASQEAAIDAWVGITAYRVQGGTAVLLGRTMRPNDGLAFSYRNAGKAPKKFLSVFGVDSKDDVHWFYPAHTDGNYDPQSIPIDPSESPRLLPDQIEHALPPGTFTVTALFMETPLRVSQIEARLSAAGVGRTDQAAFDDAVEQSLAVQVEYP